MIATHKTAVHYGSFRSSAGFMISAWGFAMVIASFLPCGWDMLDEYFARRRTFGLFFWRSSSAS